MNFLFYVYHYLIENFCEMCNVQALVKLGKDINLGKEKFRISFVN